MDILTSGYFQDGFKAIVYLVPLVYIITKREDLRLKYFWLLTAGLFLLFAGHLLDFFDEFRALNSVLIIGYKCPLHDVFEDVVGFTIGFMIFITGLYLEFKFGRQS